MAVNEFPESCVFCRLMDDHCIFTEYDVLENIFTSKMKDCVAFNVPEDLAKQLTGFHRDRKIQIEKDRLSKRLNRSFKRNESKA